VTFSLQKSIVKSEDTITLSHYFSVDGDILDDNRMNHLLLKLRQFICSKNVLPLIAVWNCVTRMTATTIRNKGCRYSLVDYVYSERVKCMHIMREMRFFSILVFFNHIFKNEPGQKI
jgi:hypothetical protein